MDSSIYIALSKQLAQFQDMELTSNNIANVNTPGYNAQKLVFSQYLSANGKTGQKDAYADTPYGYRDTSGGALQTTGNQLDVAIKGDNSYFQIETPLGTRYTKSGAFQVNSDGTLVTVDGYPVLGSDNSQISLPTTAKNVVINASGQITVDGLAVGALGVAEFANPQAMTRFGNSLYAATETPQQSLSARVVQGAIEASNVNSVSELVRVMDISRSVGATSKFIETMYDLERKASTTLSRSKQA